MRGVPQRGPAVTLTVGTLRAVMDGLPDSTEVVIGFDSGWGGDSAVSAAVVSDGRERWGLPGPLLVVEGG